VSNRKLYLAAYDVAHHRRLRRMLEVVRDYATGGQKSAYECWLDDRERDELLQRVRRELDLEEDRFACVELNARLHTRTLGKATAPARLDYFLVE